MTGRWALAPAEDGGVEVAALGPDGLLAGPADPPPRSAAPGAQSSLFEPRPVHVPLKDLVEVYADQQRRHDATAHPDRMRLLTAAESAGMLVASEMNRSGLPWSADVHRD